MDMLKYALRIATIKRVIRTAEADTELERGIKDECAKLLAKYMFSENREISRLARVVYIESSLEIDENDNIVRRAKRELKDITPEYEKLDRKYLKESWESHLCRVNGRLDEETKWETKSIQVEEKGVGSV